MDLYRRSVEIILENQSEAGSYVASPNFPVYRYSWLRDGSFIAYAMDLAGEHDSARAFFRWVGRVIRSHAHKVDRAIEKAEGGLPLGDEDALHTRFTLDGHEAQDGWWNFQLDGYGTWLWALAEHVDACGDHPLVREIAESIEITVRYLAALWNLPNYDCWEEHPDDLNPYTLAAIFGGFQAAKRLGLAPTGSAEDLEERIRDFVLEKGISKGQLVKSFRPPSGAPADIAGELEVDASLIGVATPYRLLAHDHPVMIRTTERVTENLLHPSGGVYRYLKDSYYGGGQWVLLAAWLGWHLAEAGQSDHARKLMAWVEAQADGEGNLPEQVSDHLLQPEYYDIWQARWGRVARPLLWSHAMYIVLAHALGSPVHQ